MKLISQPNSSDCHNIDASNFSVAFIAAFLDTLCIITRMFSFRILDLNLQACLKLSVYAAASLALSSHIAFAKPPSIPAPPEATVKNVSKALNYDGLPMSVQRFESNKPLSKVLSFYKKKWARPLEGHPGFMHDTEQGWDVISRLEDGYLLTVQAQAKGRFQTWGYLAVSNMGEYLFDESPKVEAFPSMDGSHVQNNIASDDPKLKGQTVVIGNRYSAQSNANFYKNHFQSRGWSIDQDKAFDQNATQILRLTKPGQELTMIIRSDKGKTEVVANKVTLD